MKQKSKVLRNGAGDFFESKSVSFNQTVDDKFLWKQAIYKFENQKLKELKKVYKNSSLQSPSSKILYVFWKKYVFNAEENLTKTKLQISKFFLEFGISKISEFEGEIIEEYVVEGVEEKYLNFLKEIKDLIELMKINVEKLSQIAANSKAFSTTLKINRATKTQAGVKLANLLNNEQKKINLKIRKWLLESKKVKGHVIPVKKARSNEIFQFKRLEISLKNQMKIANSKATTINATYENPYKGKSLRYRNLTSTKKERKSLAYSKSLEETYNKISNYSWNFTHGARLNNNRIESLPKAIEKKESLAKDLYIAQENYQNLRSKNKSAQFEISMKISKLIRQEKKLIRKKYLAFKEEWKISGASRQVIRKFRKTLRNEKKFSILKIKSKSKLFSMKQALKEKKAALKREVKYLKKLATSQVRDVDIATPVEISKRKYWTSIILGGIFPGLSALLNNQKAKAAFQLIVTALCIVALAWIFGAFPSARGNGLVGLINIGGIGDNILGTTNGVLNDSRFFLVVGGLAILILLMIIFYWIIALLNTINENNLARIGIRYSKWSQQKEFLKSAGLPYLISTPAFVFIFFIVLLPLVAMVLIAFTNFGQSEFNELGQRITFNGSTVAVNWVGFEQFTYIGTVIGDDFVNVLVWTLLWTLFSTSLTIILGSALAVIVNQNRIKGKTLIRVIYILPWAIPAFLTILFFTVFFEVNGIFNQSIGNAIFGRNVDWKNEVNYTRTILIVMQGWLGHSYMFLLVTGFLQSIPNSLYEAAKVDGASGWKQFTSITAPIIIAQVAPLLIGQFVFNFNNFTIIYLFNDGGPISPTASAGSTDIFLSWIFRILTNPVSSRPGVSAILSLIVSVFVVTPSAFAFFRSKSFRYGGY